MAIASNWPSCWLISRCYLTCSFSACFSVESLSPLPLPPPQADSVPPTTLAVNLSPPSLSLPCLSYSFQSSTPSGPLHLDRVITFNGSRFHEPYKYLARVSKLQIYPKDTYETRKVSMDTMGKVSELLCDGPASPSRPSVQILCSLNRLLSSFNDMERLPPLLGEWISAKFTRDHLLIL